MKNSGNPGGRLDEELVRDAREKAKGMIRVGAGGRPFLHFCLHNIASAGYSEVVILTGDGDSSITDYYEAGGHARDFPEQEFIGDQVGQHQYGLARESRDDVEKGFFVGQRISFPAMITLAASRRSFATFQGWCGQLCR